MSIGIFTAYEINCQLGDEIREAETVPLQSVGTGELVSENFITVFDLVPNGHVSLSLIMKLKVLNELIILYPFMYRK